MKVPCSAWRRFLLGLSLVTVSAVAMAGPGTGTVTTKLRPVTPPSLVVPAPEPPPVATVVPVPVPAKQACQTKVTRETFVIPAYHVAISSLQVNTACAGSLFAAGVYGGVPAQPVTHIRIENICP